MVVGAGNSVTSIVGADTSIVNSPSVLMANNPGEPNVIPNSGDNSIGLGINFIPIASNIGGDISNIGLASLMTKGTEISNAANMGKDVPP